MRFPSIASLAQHAATTFRRWPLAIMLCVTGVVFCILYTHLPYDSKDAHYWFWNVTMSVYLAMLLSIALTVLAERRGFSRGFVLGLQAGTVVLAVLFYFSLPDHFVDRNFIRFILFALGLHWLIAVVAFRGSDAINGFWLYNKQLFLRVLLSGLYTLVLYAGLALALWAIEKLFGVDINSRLYTDLWFALAGIFNTWFFLAGFPSSYPNPVTIDDYPKGLKIFTQYVLLPIICVYLVILYVYLFKIVFTAHWPSGWVAWLVLGFSVAGILSLLLIHPLRNETGNTWIRSFSRFFYVALFPLIVLLCCAIWRRVHEYGITELRYFILLLAAWLVFIAIYFLVSSKKNIQWIPLSLCICAFLASFGPWGVFSVSFHSQRNRLTKTLVKNGMLKDGKIVAREKPVSFEDRKTISSVLTYLVGMNDYHVLQPLYTANLDTLMAREKADGDWKRVEALAKEMHIAFVGLYETEDRNRNRTFYYSSEEGGAWAVATTGGGYVVPGLAVNAREKPFTNEAVYPLAGKDSLHIYLDSSANKILLVHLPDDTLVIDLSGVAAMAWNIHEEVSRSLPEDSLMAHGENRQWSVRLFLRSFSGVKSDSLLHIGRLEGTLLAEKKQ